MLHILLLAAEILVEVLPYGSKLVLIVYGPDPKRKLFLDFLRHKQTLLVVLLADLFLEVFEGVSWLFVAVLALKLIKCN